MIKRSMSCKKKHVLKRRIFLDEIKKTVITKIDTTIVGILKLLSCVGADSGVKNIDLHMNT